MVEKKLSALDKANKIIQRNKNLASKKAADTREKYKSIANMQLYIDSSEEKRKLLLDVIKNTIDIDTDKTLIEMGVVVYIKLLEVIKLIEDDFKEEGLEFKSITGSVSATKREKIVDWFNEDSSYKILIVSDAGGESINIKKTNHICLYNIPDGLRKYTQTIGRVCRGYFEAANVHVIQVRDTLDEYLAELISSKKEVELELLHCDNIPLKSVSSFNANVLKEIRKKKLWLVSKGKSK